MKCPLCCYQIDKQEVLNCKNCPIKKCSIKKCPNCGYDLIEIEKIESIVKRIKKLFRSFYRIE